MSFNRKVFGLGLGLILFFNCLSAQQLPGQLSMGKKRITCNKRLTIHDFFNTLLAQDRISSVVNSDQLNEYEIITCNFNNTPLDSVLSWLLRKRQLSWTYDDYGFIVTWPDGVHHQEGRFLLKRRLQDIIGYERSIGSTIECNVDDDRDVKNVKYSKVLSVERLPIGNHLPLYARYFYTSKDSTIQMVVWDWVRIYDSKYSLKEKEKILEESRRICSKEHQQFPFYKEKFGLAEMFFTACLGNPRTSTKDSIVWDTKDYHGELNLIFTPTDHRIRFKFYWK